MQASNTQQRNKQSQFVILDEIGRGTFGQVQKCMRIKDQKIVAVKTIAKIIDIDIIRQQAQAMEKFHSEHIIQLLDHFQDAFENAYVLVLPFYRKGSLRNIMDKKWQVDNIILFLYQISKGFKQISEFYFHLDLKPENILIKSQAQYTICDFGCAKALDNSKSNIKLSSIGGLGSTDYAAPEIMFFNSSKYTDVFSLGIILYEILYKKHPLKTSSAYSIRLQQFNRGKIKIEYPEIPGYQLPIQLCKQMLLPDNGKKRILWDEIIKNIYQYLKLKPSVTIVTDLRELVLYLQNVNSLLSSLIYYLHKNVDFLSFSFEKIKKDIVLFMIYHALMGKKALLGQNYSIYYMFPATRKCYKNFLATKVNKLVDKLIQQNKESDFNLGNYMAIKQNLNIIIDQLYSKVLIQQNPNQFDEWYKLLYVVKVLKNKKGLEYQYKSNLKQFVAYMING